MQVPGKISSLTPLLAGLAWLAFAGAAGAQGFSQLNSLQESGARVSAMAVDLSRQKILAELRPTARLTPASVSKLFAAAAALEEWGPDHRFVTRLASAAKVENGVLKGDLALVGAGDPSLHDRDLWSLVAKLRQAGVGRIAGDLVIDDSLFGEVPCLTVDRCAARGYSEEAYSAPLTAAGVNYSTVEIVIIPADRPGRPARLEVSPPGLNTYEIEGEIVTGKPGSAPRYAVHRRYHDNRDVIHISGSVPQNRGPFVAWRAVSRPSAYTGRILTTLLADYGIGVDGSLRIQSQPLNENRKTLAAIESDTLAEQLRRMMAYSNNFMADTLTLKLGAAQTATDGTQSLTLPLAAQTLEQLAERSQNEAWLGPPADKPPLVLDSGSGLSVSNKLSARDVIALLAYMYRQNDLFPAFLGSLPVPLHTPSRTLKNGNGDWLKRLAAKTGTLSEPVTVRALAGYMRLADGGWGAFAVIINGTEHRSTIPYNETMGAIEADLERLLDNH